MLTQCRAIESLLLHSVARFAAWVPNCKFCSDLPVTTLGWQRSPSVNGEIARWYSECCATDRARKEGRSVRAAFVAS